MAASADFLQSSIGIAFDLKPEAALGFFRAKGLQTTFAWQDMLGEAHAHAFTVAKMMDIDLLAQTRDAVDKAIDEGQTFRQFADELTPKLKAAGWWGKSAMGMVDPATGELQPNVTKGTPWRLQTIFRTNLQTAYAAGHWSKIAENAVDLPYLLYDAVDDHRTRPAHAAWDGKILPVTSKWWETHYPPNGWNCRCSVIQIDHDQMVELGKNQPDDPPDAGAYEWTNPRTGKTFKIPNGLDPGWDYNVGEAGFGKLNELMAEKLDELPPTMAAAAEANIAEHNVALVADKAISDTAKAAILEISPEDMAKAEAALAAAAEDATAKHTLAQIADNAKLKTGGGKAKALPGIDPGGWLSTAWKKQGADLQKAITAGMITPTEALDMLGSMAQQAQAQAQHLTKISQYKKAILAGKTPSPAQAAAFKSLDQEAQDALLAKIAKEQAAAAQAAEPVAAVVAPEVPAVGAPSFADLTKIGEQKGSNLGGLYRDTTTGQQWYVKLPASDDIARNEVLAGELYKLAGIEVPDLHLLDNVTIGGRAGTAIASRIVDGVAKASDLARLGERAAEGFVTDAWLANWDVVGLGYDNLLERAGRAIRIDVGGSLRYRAQGDLKGTLFGDLVRELDTLRNPSDNAQAAAVFGKLTEADLVASARRVLAVTDDEIRAAVAKYGPTSPGEATRLAETLIARKATIAARLGAKVEAAATVAEAPADLAARITSEELARIEAARLNGFVVPSDFDSIEDQAVLVWHEKDEAGKPLTTAYLKAREGAAARLNALTDALAASAPSAPDQFHDAGIFNSFETALKGIGKNSVVRAVDIARVDIAEAAFLEVSGRLYIAELDNLVPAGTHEKFTDHYRAWLDAAKQAVSAGEGGAMQWSPPSADLLKRWMPPALGVQAAPATLAEFGFKRVAGTFVERRTTAGYAQRTGQDIQFRGEASNWGRGIVRYEAQIDGVTVRYWRDDGDTFYAIRGRIEIDSPGGDRAAAERVIATLEKLGIDAKRPEPIDAELLYLRQIANHRNEAKDFDRAVSKFSDKAGQLKASRAWLAKRAGVADVSELADYKPGGERQAYGQGHLHRYRPDLPAAEFEKFQRDYRIHHTNTNGENVQALNNILNGGGQMAPTTDKLRRGFEPFGWSPTSDMKKGGASFFFTRIRPKGNALNTPGYVWRSKIVGRLDAVSYDHDAYGKQIDNYVQKTRKSTIDGWKAAALNTDGNETDFKNSLSIFDDLEMIVAADAGERDLMLKMLRDHKIEKWPDGRPIEDVVLLPGGKKP